MSNMRTTVRTAGVAVRAMLVLTVVLGLGYTLLVTGVGQLAFSWQANGSAVRDNAGRIVGSALIGQSWTNGEGAPLRDYFQSRPSAAGAGYDGAASSGSNLGPENEDLIASIEQRKAAVAAFEGVDPAEIPADAVTASASGLDPHVSPEYALLQVARVAAVRGLAEADVRALVQQHIQPPDLGYLGQARVNVLELNLALDALSR